MRLKIPLSYLLTVIFVIVLAIFLIATWTGVIHIAELYYFLASFIIGWVVVIICAILGGIFIGLFFGYRILATRSFTPFEESVLEMRDEVKKIAERLKKIEKRLSK